MRADAIFRFYSMTKPIASVGLMMLYEEGRFQLDDPASKFIPELKDLKVFAGGTADKPEVRDAVPRNDGSRPAHAHLGTRGARHAVAGWRAVSPCRFPWRRVRGARWPT